MINFSNFEPDYVKDYYQFIINKLQSINTSEDYTVIGLSDLDRIIGKKIFVNYEHNLVKPIMEWPLFGDIDLIDNPNYKYLVRIENIPEFIESDLYFEYSMPNIQNINSCQCLKDYHKKIVYFPPLLCDYQPDSKQRDEYDVITSFYIVDPESRTRRQLIYDVLNSQNFKYLNIPRVFDRELYDNYYKKSKVLVNVHQTDFHDTFEELRVLPALLNGLIVVAENSPLKESIPYSEYIVWCDYDEMIDKTNHVLENYDSYFNKIHGPESGLRNVIESMSLDLNERLKKIK